MSLSELRDVIGRLKSHINAGGRLDDEFGRQDFTQMLYELDKTLKKMDNRIDDIESKIE